MILSNNKLLIFILKTKKNLFIVIKHLITIILQHKLTTEESWRQSVCLGTSWKKSENWELKIVKKQVKTMPAKNATVKIQFLYFQS